MSAADIVLLADISETSPSGDNLELDPDFGEMERAAEGTNETQYGDTITPGTPPDWKAVETLALSLLERTRDLRVLMQLAVARLHLASVPGFAEVLTQIRHQIETRWDQVHPRLDPEDDNDPTLRTNTLVCLQDPRNVLRTLRELPLARAPGAGTVTWRDIAVNQGRLPPEPGREKHTEAFIQGVFNDTDRARLEQLRAGVALAEREIEAISSAYGTFAGPVLNLTDLSKQLNLLGTDMARFEPVLSDEREEEDPPPDDGTPQPGEEAPVFRNAAPRQSVRALTPRSLTAVNERGEAVHLLQLAAAYFRTHEPSSPVPLLVDRAIRLASMEFMDILREMAPDGVQQAQNIAGNATE